MIYSIHLITWLLLDLESTFLNLWEEDRTKYEVPDNFPTTIQTIDRSTQGNTEIISIGCGGSGQSGGDRIQTTIILLIQEYKEAINGGQLWRFFSLLPPMKIHLLWGNACMNLLCKTSTACETSSISNVWSCDHFLGTASINAFRSRPD